MNKYDALDQDTIKEIKEHQHNLDELLTIVNQLAMDKYDLGWNDGCDAGEHIGWCDCYDNFAEED